MVKLVGGVALWVWLVLAFVGPERIEAMRVRRAERRKYPWR